MNKNYEIKYVDINKIKPYERNPRNNKNAVDAVAESIKEFGFKNPIIVDKDYVVIAGHTRLKASKKLKLKEVPVIVADDLSEEQVKAYRLVDNKTNELAEWDNELLFGELENIEDIDMGLFGFDLDIENEDNEKEIIEDEIPEVDEENQPITKLGDIWQLGNHRLMCGDSTKKEDVEKLMNGTEADMVFTDPPYNVNAESRSKKNGINKILNDNMKDEEFECFIDLVFSNLYNYTKNEGAFYVWHNYRCQYVFEKYLKKNKFEIKNQIIWVKDIPAYTTNLYRQKHENCFYCNKNNYKILIEKNNDTSVWDIPSIQSAKSEDEFGNTWFKGGSKNLNLHVTQKPLSLCSKAIKNSSTKGNNVIDLFGGSGSTLIACEQLDRNCYMMELDPKYCDVIIKRWETLTGKEAVLLNE